MAIPTLSYFVPVSPGPGQIFVLARDEHLHLYTLVYGGQHGWGAWESHGGSMTASPEAVSWEPGRLDVFARGADDATFHLWYKDTPDRVGVWGQRWDSIGGTLPGTPKVVSWGPGRLDLFARGSDGLLYHNWYDASADGWGAWESLGGHLTSPPEAVSWGPGRLDVFARGHGDATFHLWYDASAGGWGRWESLGGTLPETPKVVSWGPGRYDLFARGSDAMLYHNWYDASAGGAGTWESLGPVTPLPAQGAQFPVPNLLDLVWSSLDPNGLPLNPKLGWQVHSQYGAADYYPEVGRELKPPQPWTGQITSTDSGPGCVDQAHVNWMPVTYDGYIKWSDHSPSVWPLGDDDYNFYLFTPDGAGTSRRTDGNNGGIQVEFDSDETIDHFHTAWWNQFHNDVDNGNGRVIDGKRSIVTALWGLDFQHGGQSELHPAFAMAIHVNDDPNDDRWAMFVRTFGDEGQCSRAIYWLPLPTASNGWKVYKFRLPWRPGATGVNVDDHDFLGRTHWSMEVIPHVNEWVLVTFAFYQGGGDQAPRINGTLRLQWVGAPGAYPVLNDAALANVQRATGVKLVSAAEQILRKRVDALSPDIRDRARAELTAIAPTRAVVYDNVPRSGGGVVDLSAVEPLGIADLTVRIEPHLERTDLMGQVQEVLRRYGIRIER